MMAINIQGGVLECFGVKCVSVAKAVDFYFWLVYEDEDLSGLEGRQHLLDNTFKLQANSKTTLKFRQR